MDKEMRYRKFRHNVDYLVRRLQDGDEYAFAFFLDTYGKSLYFYCNQFLKIVLSLKILCRKVS